MFNLLNKQFLFTIAFIEGASVVGAELLGVKMFVPFFGCLLCVWVSALGVILFTQMKDYDGYISVKLKTNRIILWVLLLGGLLITLMLSGGRWIIIEIIDLIIWNSVTISLLFFIALLKNNCVDVLYWIFPFKHFGNQTRQQSFFKQFNKLGNHQAFWQSCN